VLARLLSQVTHNQAQGRAMRRAAPRRQILLLQQHRLSGLPTEIHRVHEQNYAGPRFRNRPEVALGGVAHVERGRTFTALGNKAGGDCATSVRPASQLLHHRRPDAVVAAGGIAHADHQHPAGQRPQAAHRLTQILDQARPTGGGAPYSSRPFICL